MKTQRAISFMVVEILWGFCCNIVVAESDSLLVSSRDSENIYLDTDLQTITSPPIVDSGPITHTWYIHAADNKLIGVDFGYFNIKYTEDCVGGYLEIYNGSSTSGELVWDKKLCGSEANKNFLSTTSELIFYYWNDVEDPQEGFNVTFSTDEACATSSFRCWDGECIPKAQTCDGISNCIDDSDEMECAQESASLDQCGKQNFPPDFTWESRPGPQTRIIGGEEAVPGSWPWQVLVLPNGGLCGGTIINEKWVLTAAHCVIGRASNLIIVVAGVHNTTSSSNAHEQISTVAASFVHPDYINVTLGSDVALLLLDKKMVYTEYVRPICLTPDLASLPPDGTICIATGWGRTDPSQFSPTSPVLQQVQLKLRGKSFCDPIYTNLFKHLLMPDTVMCAGVFPDNNADTCQGDSGGPLVCLVGESTWYQVGITSFGFGCGLYPGFYASVGALFPWIEEITSLDLDPRSAPGSSQNLVASWYSVFVGLTISMWRAGVL